MKLELDGLTKEFGDFTAVNHIDLTMTNGVYGLLGVNGAGKNNLDENAVYLTKAYKRNHIL